MKLLIILLFLLGCTHEMLNDPSTYSDTEAGYESLYVEMDDRSTNETSVFILDIKQDLSLHSLVFSGKFSGDYKIRSKDCSYLKIGSYNYGQAIQIPVSAILGTPTSDKTCAVFFSAFPHKPEDSEHAVYPISRTIFLIASSKFKHDSNSLQLERYGHFHPFDLAAPVSTDDKQYMITKKCSRDDTPSVYGPFPFAGQISIGADDLHFDNTQLGFCYFSILYQSDEGTYRYGFTINIYREDFRPLMVLHGVQKKKYKIEKNQYVYSCGIHDESAIDDKCSRKLKELPDQFVIYAHTNKRSFYEVVKND